MSYGEGSSEYGASHVLFHQEPTAALEPAHFAGAPKGDTS